MPTNMDTSNAMSVKLTKRKLRSKILYKLKIQKEDTRSSKSNLIKRKLFAKDVFKKAKRVMFYISFDGEVSTKKMIKAAQKLGKMTLAPVCKTGNTIRVSVLNDNAKLVRGLYGADEPAIKNYFDLKKLDLVIVPGVAFEKNGRRLGRGKGCYDRFLNKLSRHTRSIGLAFDFQILPEVPATATDINVDQIIFA